MALPLLLYLLLSDLAAMIASSAVFLVGPAPPGGRCLRFDRHGRSATIADVQPLEGEADRAAECKFTSEVSCPAASASAFPQRGGAARGTLVEREQAVRVWHRPAHHSLNSSPQIT